VAHLPRGYRDRAYGGCIQRDRRRPAGVARRASADLVGSLQRKVTGCELASAHPAQRWLDLSAYGLGQRATGAEPAARGRVDRRGNLPEGRVTDLGALDRWDRHRHRLQQLRGVWMTCKLEHGLAGADLDDLAEVHHGDPVG